MNSSLYGKEYVVPSNIMSILNQQDSQRSNNLVQNGKVSYSLLKKMKSDIDNNVSDYGQEVSNWVNSQLRNSRSDVHDIKKNQMDTGMMNRFKKTHTKDINANPTQPSSLDTTHKEFMRESKKKVIKITESQLKQIIENVILKEQFETKKVFDVQQMPDDVKEEVFIQYRGKSNDSYVLKFIEADHVDIVANWLSKNGAKHHEEVILRYWW